MIRLLFAGAISMTISLFGTKALINWLTARKIGQPIRDDGPLVLSMGGQVFDLMAYFAGYGFNKSHSAAYAYLA